jgi:hypothetical protein
VVEAISLEGTGVTDASGKVRVRRRSGQRELRKRPLELNRHVPLEAWTLQHLSSRPPSAAACHTAIACLD